MTTSLHGRSLSEHISEGIFFAIEPNAKPIVGIKEGLEFRYIFIHLLEGRTCQANGQNDLVWKEFMVHVF